MAGARKHGAHRNQLGLQGAAGGTAADAQDLFMYDGFADGAATSSGWVFPYDPTSEEIFEASITTFATLTGTVTNFVSLGFQLARAGAVVNDIRVVFSSSGVVATALVPMNFNAVSGATVTGAGTGVLLVSSGVALPWTLQQGDIVILYRLSNNGTGLATPSFGGCFTTRQKSS
jgi:hypothetical protein